MIKVADSEKLSKPYYQYLFKKIHRKKDASLACYTITKRDDELNKYHLELGYFVGLDWLEKNKTALHVKSKLNTTTENEEQDDVEIDIISMLFSALKHPEVSKEVNELFIIKWDEPKIKIKQQQDLLTPFLVIEFLSLLKTIVKKGLKKSYYKVEQNLNSKVKGKIMVSKTIKQNLVKQKNLSTYCSFDEFGVNNKENRLLKKTLIFIKQYLPQYTKINRGIKIQDTFNYINPAFQKVSDQIELNEIKQTKTNSFYKEYEQALKLAKLILQRFSYNIKNTAKEEIETPPYWIDMSKLFELYVLALLKDRFYGKVDFQVTGNNGSELDFLLNDENFKMVIDTKYRLRYVNGGRHNEDMRQVSGYARLKNVYNKLNKKQGDIIDCLIIYPDQKYGEDNLEKVNLMKCEIPDYYDVYKIGVKLPVIKLVNSATNSTLTP